MVWVCPWLGRTKYAITSIINVLLPVTVRWMRVGKLAHVLEVLASAAQQRYLDIRERGEVIYTQLDGGGIQKPSTWNVVVMGM